MSKKKAKPEAAPQAPTDTAPPLPASPVPLSAPGAATGAAPSSAQGGYTVLARRYRSREFDELIGQEAIVRTLRNAIAHNRVAHAYLFTGTRGVGKTSAARLMAKELCRHPRLDAAGKVLAEVPREIEAIGAAILRGGDLDVIEIDAASNTGVDNVRELIAGAGLVPARCPYKVYIIDEVHMLSRSAFNALLKIMEEPPAHVKFILCTTEPQKVPATIQSRCQRFDFRGIPVARIAAHLRSVLEREGFAWEDEAVLHVARLAAGSMRDALTLLDRLLAAAEGKLDAHLVETMLGLPDASVVRSLVDAVAAGDAVAALAQGDELIQRGNTIDRAIDALIEHLRNLMVLSVCGGESALFEGGNEARIAARDQAERFDAAGLVHRIAQCEAAGRAVRSALVPRAIFDALLVRLALADKLYSAAAGLDGSASIRRADSGRAARDADPAASRPAQPARGAHGASTAGAQEAVTRQAMAGLGLAGPTVAGAGSGERGRPATAAAPSPPGAVSESPPKRSSQAAPPDAVATSSVGLGAAPPARAAESAAHSAPSAPSTVPPTLDELWDSIRSAAARGIDAALVAALRPVAYDGRTLRLAPASDDPSVIASVAHQGERLGELARRATGRRLTVAVEAPSASLATPSASADLEQARQHPVVREAMQLFDAVVVAAEPPTKSPRRSESGS